MDKYLTYSVVISDFFRGDSRILAVYLLGSALRGQLRPESDIDIAIIIEPGIRVSPLERVTMANKLSYTLGRTVDLGLISSKNLVYSKEAIFTGKLLFAKDESRVLLETAKLLGMYVRFNESRREVLDAYRT